MPKLEGGKWSRINRQAATMMTKPPMKSPSSKQDDLAEVWTELLNKVDMRPRAVRLALRLAEITIKDMREVLNSPTLEERLDPGSPVGLPVDQNQVTLPFLSYAGFDLWSTRNRKWRAAVACHTSTKDGIRRERFKTKEYGTTDEAMDAARAIFDRERLKVAIEFEREIEAQLKAVKVD